MTIRRADVLRTDIVNLPELQSDGYGPNSIYLSSTLVSTTNPNTVTIVLPSDDVNLLYSPDYQVDHNDIVYIYGSSGADGYYTVNTVISNTTLTVNETIATSTGGNVQLRYPPGGKLVGFDPRNAPTVQANNIQDAIVELDGYKISAYDHETLRQLIHFVDNGPGDRFAANAYREILPTGNPFPTSVTWYTDSSKAIKIVEKLITLSGIVPTAITWNMYASDGVTIVESLTDTITYVNNVFESHRVRTINI